MLGDQISNLMLERLELPEFVWLDDPSHLADACGECLCVLAFWDVIEPIRWFVVFSYEF